jgi:hypothetical protein
MEYAMQHVQKSATQEQPLTRLLLLAQGIYFLITGVWPLLHLRSFEAVSGPKTDKWLVKTVGILVGVIGALLCLVARREWMATQQSEPAVQQQRLLADPELLLLGMGSAAGLAAVDVIYVAKKRISPVYLLDALLETFFIAGWRLLWRRKQQQP